MKRTMLITLLMGCVHAPMAVGMEDITYSQAITNQEPFHGAQVMDNLALLLIEQFHPEFQSGAGIVEMYGQATVIQKNHNEVWNKKLRFMVDAAIGMHSSFFNTSTLESKEKDHVAGCLKQYIQLIDQNHQHKRLSLFLPLNFSDTQDLIDPISFIFDNIQALILKAQPVETIAQRLKGYVYGVNGTRPLCEGVQEEILTLRGAYGEDALYPSQIQLNDIIKPDKITSFKEQMLQWLPKESELCSAFNTQVDGYVSFIETILLPKARAVTILPFEIYDLMLKINGVDQDMDSLIEQGKKDYDEYYAKFKAIANEIALGKGDPERYPQDNPGVVLQNLMKDTSLSGEAEVMDMYKQVQLDLEGFLRKDDFITLPQRPLRVRPGTPAEEASFPVPHVNTPNFINNTGLTEQSWPEYVLCDLAANSSPVGAYALCAHEGRPGHDLQFSRMVEETLQGKMNLFETVLSSNSTNAEGWAHYVEYAMAPYFTLEGQLGALGDQLLRMARMFLDPQLNLGKINHEYVVNFHMDQLGFGKTAATSEADRYSFRMPGQAVTYRFGALQILKLRDDLKMKLGEKFNLRCFHDTILSFGLLPLELIKDRIEERMMVG